jgi:DNA ligase 1
VDSFEKQVMDRYSFHQISDDTIQLYERELFGHCISYDVREFTPQSSPMFPMLARAVSELDQIPKFLKGYECFYVEPKYDGERLMIHWDGQKIAMYGRSGENANLKYHDLMQRLLGILHREKPLILDGEVIAINSRDGKSMSFNEIQKMPRKNTDVAPKASLAWTTQMVAFDCLYDQHSLLKTPIIDRKARMVERINRLASNEAEPRAPLVSITPSKLELDDDSIDKVNKLVTDYKFNGLEGAILKPIGENTPYLPRSRTQWMKVKMSENSEGQDNGFGDTLDVVVMGGYWGSGSKSHMLSSFLIGVYDPSSGKYTSISKIGTGFSLKDLKEIFDEGQKSITESIPDDYIQQKGVSPDMWFSPSIVLEVNFDSFTDSPKYLLMSSKHDRSYGVSLRFPRLVKIRTEKSPIDINTVDQVIDAIKAKKFK